MTAQGLKALIVISALSLPAAAMATVTPANLTWENCVTITQIQNPTLLSARRQVQSKEDNYLGSFNSLLPNLSLSYSYSATVLDADTWQPSFSGNAQWDIFNWKDYAGIQQASAVLTQARADLSLSSAQVRDQLGRAFYQLMFAQEQIAVLESIRQLRLANARKITLGYNSGKESKGNMLITKADLASAEADLAQAQRTLRVAQETLNHAMGRGETETATVEGEFNTPTAVAWEDIGSRLPALPQIQHDDAVIAQTQAAAQQAWSQALPNVSAGYSRSWQGLPIFSASPEWAASISLNWPIFANGPTGTFFSVAGAQAQWAKAEADRQADLYQLRTAAESAWSALLQSIDQLAISRQYLEAAKQRNDEATIEYSNGLLTFENWNQVTTLLVTYEKQYLNSRLNAVLSDIDWKNALQTPLEEK